MGVSTKQQFTDQISSLLCTARLRTGAIAQQATPLLVLGAGAWAITQLSVQLANSLVLPTFTAHIHQAKTDDALMRIGAINQAQQVHFLDHSRFASDLAALELGLITQTPYYSYQLQPALSARMRSSPRQPKRAGKPGEVEPKTLPPALTVSLALPNQPGLPAYWGAVQGAADGTIAESLLCHSLPEDRELAGLAPQQQLMRRLKQRRSPRPLPPPPPSSLTCPPGYAPVSF